jgi:hypothetical protein
MTHTNTYGQTFRDTGRHLRHFDRATQCVDSAVRENGHHAVTKGLYRFAVVLFNGGAQDTK